MKYPKLRELREAIKALIKGPYTSKFPYEPHKPYERFRGRPDFHEEYCIGCTACAQVCPAKAIEFKDTVNSDGAKRTLTVRWDLCIFCGQCQANCPPEGGIVLSQEFDLATTGKREELKQTIDKELYLCETCGAVVAPCDQILWVAKKIGPLAFSNPGLILFNFRGLSSSDAKDQPAVREVYEFSRKDRFKILCPLCRREAVFKS